MNRITSLVLDFDDTLVMSEEACFELENTVLERMGRQAMGRDIHMTTWGMQIADAMPLRSPGVDMAKFWELMGPTHLEFVRNGHIDIVSEDRLAIIDKIIATRGMGVYILTSRTYTEVEHLLDPSHHLAGRIAEIYHADNTTHIKPDPRTFNNLLQKYNLEPSECVYVGDSPGDGKASNGAGMKFIASFESGLRTPQDFNGVQIDATIHHLDELPRAIEEIAA